ncbi:HAD family hydrolase [Micromonospora sp. NPDC047730]|uniref:HAD family hydrolase n=1 Tax=Micromonospora sp. NPDC047730 TaxID=3364253 RepID=UPI0037146D37
MRRPVQAVLFDVDDTLIDYASAEYNGIVSYLRALGVEGELDAAAARFGELQAFHFDRFLAGRTDYVGQARALAVDMIAWMKAPSVHDPYRWFLGYRERYEASLRLFPDVLDGLASLGNVPLGIVTNSDTAFSRVKLRRVGLLSRFHCVVGVDAAGVSKPHPRIFHAGCAALGYPPAVTAYVGDNKLGDAAAADAAGLLGVWVNRFGAGGDGVTDLRQLAAVLKLDPGPVATLPRQARLASGLR